MGMIYVIKERKTSLVICTPGMSDFLRNGDQCERYELQLRWGTGIVSRGKIDH